MNSLKKVKLPIGEKLEEVWYTSFFLDGKLDCEILVIYFLFRSGVYRITSSDGYSEITFLGDIDVASLEKTEGEYYYPIKLFNKSILSNVGELTKVEEFFWQGRADESAGFVFRFKMSDVVIFSKDDCLELYSSLEQLDRNFILKEVIPHI